MPEIILDHVLDEPLEILRDRLRQASVYSPSPLIRSLCARAVDDPSDDNIRDACNIIRGCKYASRVRAAIAQYHGARNV